MSTLDKAFIRAYQKQRVIPAPHVAFPAPQPEPQPPLAESEQPPAVQIAPPAATDSPSAAESQVAAPALPAIFAPSLPAPVRAALEVEQFDWPETVEALRLSSADYFSAWVEQFPADSCFTVAATSEVRGAGRTTVLLAAVRHLSLARPEAKIALVDADFRCPDLAVRLGLALEIGFEDVISGEQPLEEALVESLADRVTLLALRADFGDEQLALGKSRLDETLRRLQQSFDFVCLDLGPLAELTDESGIAALGAETPIDAALVVRDMRRAGDADNAAVGRRLEQLGVWHWDLVENFVQGRP